MESPTQPRFAAPRRVMTAPLTSSCSSAPTSSQSAGSLVETLYNHPNVKIVAFSSSGRRRARSPGRSQPDEEPGSLSSSSHLERTIAVGLFRIYRAPGSVAFLNCGTALQPILPKSQCWCIDEQSSKFVLQIRRPQYWRIEVPVDEPADRDLAHALRGVMDQILQFEKTPCPFQRSFSVQLPEPPKEPPKKKPWVPVRRSLPPLSTPDYTLSPTMKPRSLRSPGDTFVSRRKSSSGRFPSLNEESGSISEIETVQNTPATGGEEDDTQVEDLMDPEGESSDMTLKDEHEGETTPALKALISGSVTEEVEVSSNEDETREGTYAQVDKSHEPVTLEVNSSTTKPWSAHPLGPVAHGLEEKDPGLWSVHSSSPIAAPGRSIHSSGLDARLGNVEVEDHIQTTNTAEDYTDDNNLVHAQTDNLHQIETSVRDKDDDASTTSSRHARSSDVNYSSRPLEDSQGNSEHSDHHRKEAHHAMPMLVSMRRKPSGQVDIYDVIRSYEGKSAAGTVTTLDAPDASFVKQPSSDSQEEDDCVSTSSAENTLDTVQEKDSASAQVHEGNGIVGARRKKLRGFRAGRSLAVPPQLTLVTSPPSKSTAPSQFATQTDGEPKEASSPTGSADSFHSTQDWHSPTTPLPPWPPDSQHSTPATFPYPHDNIQVPKRPSPTRDVSDVTLTPATRQTWAASSVISDSSQESAATAPDVPTDNSTDKSNKETGTLSQDDAGSTAVANCRRSHIRHRATTSNVSSVSRRALSPLPPAANLFSPSRTSTRRRPAARSRLDLVRRAPMAIIAKTCEILLSPPSHLINLMLSVAARIAAGEWRGMVFGYDEAGEAIPVQWDYSDGALSDWGDDDDYYMRQFGGSRSRSVAGPSITRDHGGKGWDID